MAIDITANTANSSAANGYRFAQSSFIADDFSISCWLNCSQIPPSGGQGTVMRLWGATAAVFRLYQNPTTGYLVWEVRVTTPATITATGATNVTATGWRHVVCTWGDDVLAKGARMYLDGVLGPSTASAATAVASSTEPLQLGIDNAGQYGFRGYLADARVYNRQLATNEALTLFGGRGRDNLFSGMVHRSLLGSGATGGAPTDFDMSYLKKTPTKVGSPLAFGDPFGTVRAPQG